MCIALFKKKKKLRSVTYSCHPYFKPSTVQLHNIDLHDRRHNKEDREQN